MARPAPWRLSPDAYPHHEAIQTRFQDLDVLGHINNVAYAALFESGRVRFNNAAGLARWPGHRWLVAQVIINYLAEGHFPQDVTIASGIGDIGTRSWQILSAAFQGGTCIASCDVVLVLSTDGGATAIPAEFRAALDKWRVRGA
ncbi:thioesterase family protein [Sphingomonas sp.]|uniref:acyl-CoA thioesterase n=1 Tax=Sphingomonas sp. TaxID=28214 RepID=UPI001DD6F211|nr:acyl-CoA thioesterase [Sphingomonas sp.]MBX9797026.1 acyl-CoA thioesterase [Sphingomonas sp.]